MKVTSAPSTPGTGSYFSLGMRNLHAGDRGGRACVCGGGGRERRGLDA